MIVCVFHCPSSVSLELVVLARGRLLATSLDGVGCRSAHSPSERYQPFHIYRRRRGGSISLHPNTIHPIWYVSSDPCHSVAPGLPRGVVPVASNVRAVAGSASRPVAPDTLDWIAGASAACRKAWLLNVWQMHLANAWCEPAAVAAWGEIATGPLHLLPTPASRGWWRRGGATRETRVDRRPVSHNMRHRVAEQLPGACPTRLRHYAHAPRLDVGGFPGSLCAHEVTQLSDAASFASSKQPTTPPPPTPTSPTSPPSTVQPAPPPGLIQAPRPGLIDQASLTRCRRPGIVDRGPRPSISKHLQTPPSTSKHLLHVPSD